MTHKAEFVNGPNRIRRNVLQAGEVLPIHFHAFGHTMYMPAGAGRLDTFNDDDSIDRSVELTAGTGNFEYIPENKKHCVTAHVDNTICDCIFASRTPDGEVAQYDTGWTGASAGADNG